MAESLDTQLTRVQSAIAAIESGGQSVSIQGVTYTRAQLQTLYAREEALLRRINRESQHGITRTVAEF